jgi:Rha family phage regulatory protein
MTQLVFIDNERPLTDSLIIAEKFGKEHRNVTRDISNQIEKLIEAGKQEFVLLNFERISYKDSLNRDQTKYLLTEDAFAIVVMSYVTIEAMKFKTDFLIEFNRMKMELLQQKFSLPRTFSESLRLLAAQIEETEKERTEKLQLVSRIEEDKPKVQFAETCMTSDRSVLVREVAKLASKQGVMIGERRLFQKLRDWGMFVIHYNEPTQRAMEMGLFELKKGVYAHPDGARDYTTPKVTVKGQIYIINRLLKEAA